MTANQLIIGSIDLSPYIYLKNWDANHTLEIGLKDIPVPVAQSLIISAKKDASLQPFVYCSEGAAMQARPTMCHYTHSESRGNYFFRAVYYFNYFRLLHIHWKLSFYQMLGVIV